VLGALRRLVGRGTGADEPPDARGGGSASRASAREGEPEVRIDAARERLRAAIPPISDDDELDD
jgi:hypothetical protein